MIQAAKVTIAVAGIVVLFLILLLAYSHAGEREQTRVYDARGNSVGTIVPQGDGSTRFYDARGNSTGTSTTTGNTTRYYSPLGNHTTTTVAPRDR